MENEVTLRGHVFLKEAAPKPQALANLFSRGKKVGFPAPKPKGPSMAGTFVGDSADSAVQRDSLKIFSPEQVAGKANDIKKREGTGSFIADGLLGLTKRVVPKTKDGIDKSVVKIKDMAEQGDTAAGKVLAGNKPDSLRGKMFSSKVSRQVGEVKNPDGNISPLTKEDRRPSLSAPVQNTAKFVSPFLATAYVAEKMYPGVGETEPKETHENNTQKTAGESVSGPYDGDVIEGLDKMASMQKIAELEKSVQKYAEELSESRLEKEAAERRLEVTIKEKETLEKVASDAKNAVMEKQAAFEELRLRTIAQKRSKTAVDLAERMVDVGLIKQAELQDTIDDLMTCDERTIKMYQNMSKQANNQEESLESLAILGEYKDNEKLAMNPKELGGLGLSVRGQSIGDAARDLNK